MVWQDWLWNNYHQSNNRILQVAEIAMASAAQQVLNANMAAGQAQSPEQQMVALETAKVELEKQKLQQLAAK